MEKTIKETTRLLLNGTLSKEDADKILLDLYNVSGRSELLRDYFKWHKEQGYVSHKDSDINEFLASNCH